jgi:hypothetical protein
MKSANTELDLALHVLEELGEGDAERLGQPDQRSQGDVVLAGLNLLQMLRIDLGAFCCLLLGEFLSLPECADSLAQPLLDPFRRRSVPGCRPPPRTLFSRDIHDAERRRSPD